MANVLSVNTSPPRRTVFNPVFW